MTEFYIRDIGGSIGVVSMHTWELKGAVQIESGLNTPSFAVLYSTYLLQMIDYHKKLGKKLSALGLV